MNANLAPPVKHNSLLAAARRSQESDSMSRGITPLDIVKRVSNGPIGKDKRYSVPNKLPPSVQKNKTMLSMYFKNNNDTKKAQGAEQKIVINRPATNQLAVRSKNRYSVSGIGEATRN